MDGLEYKSWNQVVKEKHTKKVPKKTNIDVYGYPDTAMGRWYRDHVTEEQTMIGVYVTYFILFVILWKMIKSEINK